MRKRAALLLILNLLAATAIITFNPVSAVSGDSWVSKAPMHQARSLLGVTVVNGKIYAIGGSTQSGLYPPDILGGLVGTNEEYDPATDSWSFKKSMPTPRDYFAIASYQNKIYCMGGAVGMEKYDIIFSSYVASGVNEVYDTATNTWETKTPMPEAKMQLQANVVNGKIYVLGVGHTYAYDPATDSWTPKKPIPAVPPTSSWSYPVSVVVDNRIFVTGEFSTGAISSEEKTFIYNTETDSWSQGTPAPSIVLDGPAGATTGLMAPKRIYVLGVQGGNYPPPTNYVYDLQSDSWTAGAPVPTNRIHFGIAVVDDKLYAIGGYTFNSPNNGEFTVSAVNEQYTPVGYGTVHNPPAPFDDVPPEITVSSPENKTYDTNELPLTFNVNEPGWIRYKLDNNTDVELDGNTTITELSPGSHSLTVYATDAAGNTGASETVYFTVAGAEASPTVFIVAALGVALAAVGIGLLISTWKRIKKTKKATH